MGGILEWYVHSSKIIGVEFGNTICYNILDLYYEIKKYKN
jgi:hypothetical protein